MIIVVDELPKCCYDCPCFYCDRDEDEMCGLLREVLHGNIWTERAPKCPLKKLEISNDGLWGWVILGKEIGKQRFTNPV